LLLGRLLDLELAVFHGGVIFIIITSN
jgi:hypothetical protein